MTLRSFLRSARVVLWGAPKATRAEERLLRKIDWAVLSFTCLMYWSNYLNRANFANAYVSGMKNDVGLEGNDYSLVNTIFTIGYIVGQIPNNLMLQVVPAHYWLPGMALLWGCLSACTAAATRPWHVMLIRFFQAIVESSTFSGTHFILGSWYLPDELGKRSAIFSSSAQMGTMFSGVMQGSILKTMNGYRGLASWQWLFILDLIIAAPIALYGFLMFPGTPQRGRRNGSWFLSKEEQQLAVERLPVHPQTKMGWNLIQRCLGRWHIYAFSALFAISSMLETVGSNGLMQLWLATEERISVADRSFYPLGAVAVAIVSTFVASWITDFTQNRWPVNIAMSAALLFTSIVLLVWPASYGFRFFAFTFSGIGYMGQSTNFVWCNIVVRDDTQERAVTLASMNMFSNVMQAWWSITLFPATSAPRFHRGWIGTIVIAVLTVAIAYGTHRLDRRDQRRRPRPTTAHDQGDAVSASDHDHEHDDKGEGEKTDAAVVA